MGGGVTTPGVGDTRHHGCVSSRSLWENAAGGREIPTSHISAKTRQKPSQPVAPALKLQRDEDVVHLDRLGMVDRFQQNRPEAAIRGNVQTTLHVNHAPQKRLLKKRVASPNPASYKSF